MYDFTTTDVRNKINELVKANPTFVYEKPEGETFCQYVHKNEYGQYIEGEGCVVGQALVALGVERRLLDVETDAVSLFEELGIKGSDEDAEWCGNMQGYQDSRKEWRYAKENADIDERQRDGRY